MDFLIFFKSFLLGKLIIFKKEIKDFKRGNKFEGVLLFIKF